MKIKESSIVLANVHRWDHPDYCDAYIEYAEWENGEPLTEEELELTSDTHGDLINELACERAWQE